jgi:hypothetical protein
LGYYRNSIPIEWGIFIFHCIFGNLGTKKPEKLKLHNFEKKTITIWKKLAPKKHSCRHSNTKMIELYNMKTWVFS